MRQRQELTRLFLLALTAFTLRLIVLTFFIDIPGDGPTRAILAYNWSKSPHISTHGIWLPGFMYLAGIFSFIVNDPLFVARILNLIIGTLTVPFFYIFIRRIYGVGPALFSSSILAFLPLHIGLSASSLTEVSFVFEMIAGMLFLLMASDKTKRQRLYLCLSLFCLCLGMMTRYEAWPLVPIVPFYYFWKTGKLSTVTIIIIILVAVPLTWSIGNYHYVGDFYLGLHAAELGAEAVGLPGVDLVSAIKIICRKSVSHLGWILFTAVIWGAILYIIQAVKGKMDLERTLYLMTTAIFWAFMLYLAVSRGKSLWDRYLLFGLVMAVPLAALPIMHYVSNYRRLILIICIALLSVGLSNFVHRPEIYVTARQPSEIKTIADWLKKSPYGSNAILLTRMGWESSYLPLYFPEISMRHLTVSPWTHDYTLQEFLKNHRPSLLITRDGDEEFQSRIEHFLGNKSYKDRLIEREGTIKIYLLSVNGTDPS